MSFILRGLCCHFSRDLAILFFCATGPICGDQPPYWQDHYKPSVLRRLCWLGHVQGYHRHQIFCIGVSGIHDCPALYGNHQGYHVVLNTRVDEHEVQCLVVESGVTAAIGHSAVDTVLSEVNFQLIEPGVFRVWLDDRFQVDARSAAVRRAGCNLCRARCFYYEPRHCDAGCIGAENDCSDSTVSVCKL